MIWTVMKNDGKHITNGFEEWYVNGKLHRVDGPAVTWPRGTSGKNTFWYWRDEIFHPDDFNESWPDDKKAWWMRAKLNNL